jgi:hypothetical protein
MKMIKANIIVVAIVFLFSITPLPASDKALSEGKSCSCSEDAIKQARKLLEFHAGPDDRIEVDKEVKRMAPISNPAGKGHFDVLEVWGHIYKGKYRMRFIYRQSPNDCTLMGQEILEFATE